MFKFIRDSLIDNLSFCDYYKVQFRTPIGDLLTRE